MKTRKTRYLAQLNAKNSVFYLILTFGAFILGQNMLRAKRSQWRSGGFGEDRPRRAGTGSFWRDETAWQGGTDDGGGNVSVHSAVGRV